MSQDRTATQKKRTPAPDGDHRKRRRNRTTQSCLNCHTSKRMCDRKRPCGRCTQLGLTGLCVYEVDDPSQRVESQDDSARLRSRVAELEGVIREMKNKPHPRWVVSGVQPSDESEKWSSRMSAGMGDGAIAASDPHQSSASSPPRLQTDSGSDNCESISAMNEVSPQSPSIPLISVTFAPSVQTESVSAMDGSHDLPSYTSYFNTPSPLSTPSPGARTPNMEYGHPQVTIAGNEHEISHGLDLASILSSYPGLMDSEDRVFPHHGHCMGKDNLSDEADFMHNSFSRPVEGHCGCLNESISYNVLLELSLRLRKAADILSRSSNHRLGSRCLLNQRIAELDAFATTTLGNTANPTDNMTPPLSSYNGQLLNNDLLHPTPIYGSTHCKLPLSAPTHSLRTWDMTSSGSDIPSPCDDSFMSWEPTRRT